MVANLYADVGVIDRLVGHGTPVPSKLEKGLEDERFRLCISSVHLMEVMKAGDSALLDVWVKYLDRLDTRGGVRWMAEAHLLYLRELGHYRGTLLCPTEGRAFVPSMAHVFANDLGFAQPGSVLDVRPLDFLRQLRSADGAEATKRLADYNARLDHYRAKLKREREMITGMVSPSFAPFGEFVESVIDTKVVNVIEVARDIRAMENCQAALSFPALWMRYALEISLIRSNQKEFADGDLRDLLHATYLPYVDLMTADRRFMERVKTAEHTGTWFMKLRANGDVINDGDWGVM